MADEPDDNQSKQPEENYGAAEDAALSRQIRFGFEVGAHEAFHEKLQESDGIEHAAGVGCG